MTTPTNRVTVADQERMADQLDHDTATAERNGEHYFIVNAAFRISPALAATIATGENVGALLDRENLVALTTGCLLCEQPITPELVRSPCPGGLS